MRRRILIEATFAAAVFGAFQSCTTPEATPELKVVSEPVEAPPGPSAPPDRLAALDRVTGEHGHMADDVKDLRAMLTAQDLEAKGDDAEAAKAWFEALTTAEGGFGKKALEGWIKAYTKALGRKTDRIVLARLLLAEARGGEVSPYMRAKGLTTDKALSALLPALIGTSLIPDPAGDAADGTLAEPPAHNGIPSDDPLLTRTAAKHCGAKRRDEAQWQRWLATLPAGVQPYWNALLAQCEGKALDALQAFHAIAPLLVKSKETQGLALESVGHCTALERSLSRKKDAAETFRDVMEMWDAPGVTPKALGLDATAFALRRVDETLWASRYRALVGDYENSKIYAQKALDLIANAYASKSGVANGAREKLADLRAEAYQVLAYRIAVEKREFDSALSLNLLALQAPHLTREWQDRLTWLAGLYDYLGGNFESAKKRWEALLPKTQDDAVKAAIYFWLAKVYDHLDRKDESRFYLNALADDFPLSYYATVAPRSAGIAGEKDWRQVFGDPAELRRKLASGGDYGIDKLRRIPEQRRLLARAEILAAAGLTDWLKIAADDLARVWPADLVNEGNAGVYLYLSRLQLAAGEYAKSIALTTKLAHAIPQFWHKYPEQLLVYYPVPYGETFQRNAIESGVDREVLLAVSRQESSFTADIKSPANAIGIMQLIPPTGETYARELGITDYRPIEDYLRHPEGNIRLGAHYLKFLNLHFKGFPPAIYGGYNAGEYAMETWLERRGHSDPLMFVELVPFGETKDYIRNVWRNLIVYRFLEGKDTTSPIAPGDLSERQRADAAGGARNR